MRFEEINSHDIPVPGMRVWRVEHAGCIWVIAYEPGMPTWSADARRRFRGYTATYRSASIPERQPRLDGTLGADITRIDGLWRTKAEAEAACLAVSRSMS